MAPLAKTDERPSVIDDFQRYLIHDDTDGNLLMLDTSYASTIFPICEISFLDNLASLARKVENLFVVVDK